LTTIRSDEPVEFSTLSPCHNFNLQLSGAVLVRWSGRASTQLVAPGQVSLNVAGEPFRAVVWPTPGMLTLHVPIPPALIALARDREVRGRASGPALTPSLGEWDARLRSVALQLAEAVRVPDPSDRLHLDQLRHELAVELVRRHDGPRASPHEAGRMAVAKLRDVIEYLHERAGEAISLPDLAGVAGLSPYHFARSFKASVGVTPHRYLSEIRLARARLLLATTTRSVTSIALSLGFDTPSHFATAFRTGVGMTPSEFRRRAR
jgi:AraC family transcriptional regulator